MKKSILEVNAWVLDSGIKLVVREEPFLKAAGNLETILAVKT